MTGEDQTMSPAPRAGEAEIQLCEHFAQGRVPAEGLIWLFGWEYARSKQAEQDARRVSINAIRSQAYMEFAETLRIEESYGGEGIPGWIKEGR